MSEELAVLRVKLRSGGWIEVRLDPGTAMMSVEDRTLFHELFDKFVAYEAATDQRGKGEG